MPLLILDYIYLKKDYATRHGPFAFLYCNHISEKEKR